MWVNDKLDHTRKTLSAHLARLVYGFSSDSLICALGFKFKLDTQFIPSWVLTKPYIHAFVGGFLAGSNFLQLCFGCVSSMVLFSCKSVSILEHCSCFVFLPIYFLKSRPIHFVLIILGPPSRMKKRAKGITSSD